MAKAALLKATLPFLVLLGGCAREHVESNHTSFYLSPEYNLRSVRRVLIVPFNYTGTDPNIAADLVNALGLQLQKSGLFEVVFGERVLKKLDDADSVWVKGVFNVDAVQEARKKFQADAIVFGTITHYYPVEPAAMGVRLQMISAETGVVLWSADAAFDSSQRAVSDAVKRYYKENYAKDYSLYGWKVVLVSTRRYADFVSHEMVRTLADRLPAA